jgi:hypothetical protein
VNEEPLIFKAVLYWVYNKDYKSVVGSNNETVTVDLDLFLKVYNMAVKYGMTCRFIMSVADDYINLLSTVEHHEAVLVILRDMCDESFLGLNNPCCRNAQCFLQI